MVYVWNLWGLQNILSQVVLIGKSQTVCLKHVTFFYEKHQGLPRQDMKNYTKLMRTLFFKDLKGKTNGWTI